MNSKFDVIILSLAVDADTFGITKSCVDSYINTANSCINNIFVVETNSKFSENYGFEKVSVIKPNKQFNYNEFFNIALEKCQSEYIVGPNNDLQIQQNCLQTLLHEFETNENVHSISPVDREWHRHTKMYLPTDNKLYYGYEVSLHMFGCIFACRRSIFNKIGYLDERFYFFYQDNDYINCLRSCGFNHGVHTGAHVKHVSGFSNKYAEERLRYTPNNMNEQGILFSEKWSKEPFVSGGYQQYKPYP